MNQLSNILFILERHLNSYTKSEKKLYEYIKSNLDKIIYFSITELSEQCNVGEATILRFCRKIGFKGYQHFKLAIAQDVAQTQSNNENNTYIEKIKYNMIRAIEDTYSFLENSVLEEAIKMIDRSNNIVLFGIGVSGITAIEAKYRLMRIGKKVDVITDSHFQMMYASTLDESWVVISISLSGSTRDIVDATKLAKEKGAQVIAITNYIKSPLEKYADVVLITAAKEHPLEGGSFTAKISQLYIIDLLCTGLSLINSEYSKKMREETAKAIIDKVY